MKCVKFGKISDVNNRTIDISDLGFTSTEDFIVLCDGTIRYGNGYFEMGLESKTPTSITLGCEGIPAQYINGSYQILALK